MLLDQSYTDHQALEVRNSTLNARGHRNYSPSTTCDASHDARNPNAGSELAKEP